MRRKPSCTRRSRARTSRYAAWPRWPRICARGLRASSRVEICIAQWIAHLPAISPMFCAVSKSAVRKLGDRPERRVSTDEVSGGDVPHAVAGCRVALLVYCCRPRFIGRLKAPTPSRNHSAPTANDSLLRIPTSGPESLQACRGKVTRPRKTQPLRALFERAHYGSWPASTDFLMHSIRPTAPADGCRAPSHNAQGPSACVAAICCRRC
jgi:hypothetical protein